MLARVPEIKNWNAGAWISVVQEKGFIEYSSVGATGLGDVLLLVQIFSEVVQV